MVNLSSLALFFRNGKDYLFILQRRQQMKHFKSFPSVLILIITIVLAFSSYLSAAQTLWDDFNSDSFNLTEFNTFKFLWSDDSEQWYLDPDQIRGQDLYPDVLISETSSVMPDEPLTLRMNFWAATSDLLIAWDGGMMPSPSPVDDIVCFQDVDYIRIMRIPTPASLLLVAIGLLSLRFIRRLVY